jgi:hypothetical protein
MTVDPISQLFDRMDDWRHFPDYQLERRADILFSLYMCDVLESKLGFPILDDLAPEFPVRIGTIYQDIPINRSYKIDYLAMSTSGKQPILVELKTEGLSRRVEQDKYLLASQQAGLTRLLDGLLDIFRATNSKRKYFSLLLHLERMKLVKIPDTLSTIMAGSSLYGATEASRQVQILAQDTEPPLIVYVQPSGNGPDVISFREYADFVENHDHVIAQRFAQSLREWATVEAGDWSSNQRFQRTAP